MSMNIINYNEYILLSESLSTARKNYLQPGKITANVFKELTDIDISKTKKYLDRICLFYVMVPNLELYTLKRIISIYHDAVERKLTKRNDINTFATFDEFKKFVDTLKDLKSKTAIKQAVKDKECELILDREDVFIISPLTHKAAQIYGAGTKWCITEGSSNYWDSYMEKNAKLYFVIDKSKTQEEYDYKVAIVVFPQGNKECYDAEDDRYMFKDILKVGKGLNEDIFKPKELTEIEKLSQFIKNNPSKKIYKKITQNADGSVDIEGDVHFQIPGQEIDVHRFPVQFNKINGSFNCSNVGLKTLKGGPKIVTGDFNVSDNSLRSLEHAPQKVGGVFDCHGNNTKFTKQDVLNVCEVEDEIFC